MSTTRTVITQHSAGYHSNSLNAIELRPKFLRCICHHAPSALGEQVVFAVDVDHPVLENAFPLVLDTSDLE